MQVHGVVYLLPNCACHRKRCSVWVFMTLSVVQILRAMNGQSAFALNTLWEGKLTCGSVK